MPQALPRCQLVPEPVNRVSFRVDGEERLAWCFDEAYPRPFFYPVVGPAGVPLTRMGHPGAPNHDHHQSVWFAHADTGGTDFWSNQGKGVIRQGSWLCYEDGDLQAAMAVRLIWKEGQRERLVQDLVAVLRPLPDREFLLDLQSTFLAKDEPLEMGQSNFGVLAIRVARSLSVHFGRGKLTSSEGAEDEAGGFGQYARWWDYSGPVAPAPADGAEPVWNGITCFDHPANPNYPAHWHVREDGWMGPSLTRLNPLTVSAEQPLHVRYLLHVHAGPYDADAAERVARSFEEWPRLEIIKSSKPHLAYELVSGDPSHEKEDRH